MAISLADFNLEKVSFADPETDSYGNTRVPIKYERNGKQGFVTFNLPTVRTDNNGVTTQKSESGAGSHSIKIFFPRKKPVFIEDRDPETDEVIGGHYEEPETIMGYAKKPKDPNDPKSELIDDLESGVIELPNDYTEAQAYADIIDQIYAKAVDHCFANKAKLGLAQAKQKIMVEAQIKNPVYRRQVSEQDDSEDTNYAPSIYLKFIESGPKGSPPNTVYTRFTGLDQKPISWRSLEDTMMYLVPTLRLECIFLGAKKNIQCKVTSCIVLETKAREEMSTDMKTAQDLLTQNPALLQAFLKSLGGLEKYRDVKRESDFVKKPKEVAPKVQPPEGKGEEKEGGEGEEEVKVPVTKVIPEGQSPLEGFMKQQTAQVTPTTPAKRVIPRRTTATPTK